MSTLFRLELAGLPPSVNQMYRTGRQGQRYKRPEVEEWQDEVAKQLREAWGDKRPFVGEVLLKIEFSVKTNRRWDVDNRLKALIDCLELGGVIHDDAQVAGINAKRVNRDEIRTIIEMSEYPYWE